MRIKFSCALVLSVLAQGAICAIGYNSTGASGGGTAGLDVRASYASISESNVDFTLTSEIGPVMHYLPSSAVDYTMQSDEVERITVPRDEHGDGLSKNLFEGTSYYFGTETDVTTFTVETLTIPSGCDIIIRCDFVGENLIIGDDVTIHGPGSFTITESISGIEDGTMTLGMLTLPETSSMTADSLVITSNGVLDIYGTLTVSKLYLHDGVRMTVDPLSSCSVESDIYIGGDVFVDSPYSLGNATTHVDFTFTGDAFRYFTPPFDIAASAFGTVQTDISNGVEDNSVWIYAYDEANEALDPTANAWTLIDPETTLLAGKGYSIWASIDQVPDSVMISLSSDVSYPNTLDLISQKVQYTIVDNDFESNGMNALGNPFSLPLALTGERQSVRSYFYFNGSKYITMSNGIKVGDGFDTQDDPLVIPSYGLFYASVETDESLDFSLEDLSASSSLVRLKSTSQSEAEYIRLIVQTDADYDDAVLRFVDDASFGSDSYDVKKMFVPTSDVDIQISTSLTGGSGSYAIQSFPRIDSSVGNEIFSVPFKFTTSKVGVFYISATLTNLTLDQVTPYLYDDETGELTELTEELLALTISSSYDRSGRFSIKGFSAIPTSINEDDLSESISIYTSDNILYLETTTDQTGIIKMLDVSGKFVDERNFNSSCSFSLSTLPKGVYVIHVSTNDQLTTVKKIIVQ